MFIASIGGGGYTTHIRNARIGGGGYTTHIYKARIGRVVRGTQLIFVMQGFGGGGVHNFLMQGLVVGGTQLLFIMLGLVGRVVVVDYIFLM